MAMIGAWSPINGTHAIQMAAVGIDFVEPLPDRLWEKVYRVSSDQAQARGLKTENQIQTFTVALGEGPEKVNPTTATGGVDFRRMERPDFFSDRFSLTKNGMRIEDWSYTRWAALKEKVSALMAPAFQIFADATSLAHYYIEYVDVFQAPLPEADVSVIVSEASPYVAAGAFRDNASWHTHCGFFEYLEPGVRRLSQMNIDVGDLPPIGEPDSRAIQVRTYLANQILRPAGFEPEWMDTLAGMQKLHEVSKERLKSVLTENAARAIALK